MYNIEEEIFNKVKYILELNKINCIFSLERKFPDIYQEFLKLSIDKKNLLFPQCNNKYNLFTFSDFKNFIEEFNIKTRSDFYKKYSGAYKLFCKLLSNRDKELLLLSTYTNYNNLVSVDDFREFISINNIVSRGDFSKRFKSGYKKFMELSEKDRNILLPSLIINNYCDLKTENDFSLFVKQHNIKSRRDFDNRFYKGYVRFCELLSDNEKDNILPQIYKNYSNLNSFEDFKEFIEFNKITSRKDFCKYYRGGYEKFLLLSKVEKDELLPVIKSSGEIYLSKIFIENSIIFEEEKIFEDFISYAGGVFRYDFFLPEINTLVEYHGSQHFNEKTGYYTKEGIERDKLKYEYAKQNNIPILYFTNEVEIYKKYGYFTEVITDANILIQRIKEIGLTNQSNS